MAVALAGGMLWWFFRPSPGPFPNRGGEVFAERVVNDVPQFFQDDPRWREDLLGSSGSRMGSEGCAVVCAAMVLRGYGVDTDPGRLNRFLSGHPRGYTPRGWVYWEGACEIASDRVGLVYEGPGSYRLLDRALREGLTPIIKVFLPEGISHFLVVVGKEGNRYLVRDPLRRCGGQVVFLDEFYSGPIHGVRLYQPRQTP